MSRKLFSSITILILCCISLFAGVFAASNANHTISGNLSYEVESGITAKVTNVEFTNVTTYCRYYSSSAGHNTLTTSELFNITVPNANVTITDSNNCLTITNSGTGTNQTITYTGYTNYTGTLTCKIISTGQSATITYTTKYTNYDHTWEWKDNGDDRHWEECINCEEQQNNGLHEYSSAEDNGDGTHNATCDICGLTVYEYYHVESNGENERDDYDDSNCWNYCDLCGAITDDSTHSIEWTENTDPTYHWDCCVYCSCQINKEEHNWAWDAGSDEEGHWTYCYDCGYELEKEPHSDSGYGQLWYDDEYHWNGCDSCTHPFNVESHDWIWEYDNNYHWEGCSVCEAEQNYASHNFTWDYYNGSYCQKSCLDGCGYSALISHEVDELGYCGNCGGYIGLNKASMIAETPSATSTPILSTYGVLNNTLDLAQSSGMLEAPDVMNKSNLLYNFKKQYIYKIKKILSLM